MEPFLQLKDVGVLTLLPETANIFYQLTGIGFCHFQLDFNSTSSMFRNTDVQIGTNQKPKIRAPTNTSQSSKFTTGFSIIAQNDARLTQYSWTKNVTLFLYSFIGATTISLKQNQVVEVNGVRQVIAFSNDRIVGHYVRNWYINFCV